KRHHYFVTSFDKVPGTVLGHSLPDMLSDIQDVANAALRNLVNNMSMASGPQVVIMSDQLAPGEEPEDMYPWKRWLMEDNPMGGSQARPPVSFFQPQSNASELLGIYQKMTEIADEVSAIPRYITGSGAPGGAGRTASGLSMLMGNASKILQQVAHNVDTDILKETLTSLYDLVMVADAGVSLRGDENIVVKGVSTVLSKEAERARQLEFLSLTSNPIDTQIMGIEGRASILRALADDLGLPGENAVPDKAELEERKRQALAAQQDNAAAQAKGEGDAPPSPRESTGPITNTVQPGFSTGGV
ncbi:MAG: hemophilus-specific protein, partial [Candidatus Thermoplasmatota archaeon]|nr:hemophilus-specific protein [Candidatus Thermoplasmatota archaeon]